MGYAVKAWAKTESPSQNPEGWRKTIHSMFRNKILKKGGKIEKYQKWQTQYGNIKSMICMSSRLKNQNQNLRFTKSCNDRKMRRVCLFSIETAKSECFVSLWPNQEKPWRNTINCWKKGNLKITTTISKTRKFSQVECLLQRQRRLRRIATGEIHSKYSKTPSWFWFR